MKRAIIDQKNIVVSVVIWPDGSFIDPRDHKSVESDVARLGDSYDGKNFIKPDGSIRQ